MRGAWSVALVLLAPALMAGCAEMAQQAAEAAIDEVGCIDASAAQSRAGQFQYAGAVSCKSARETHAWTNPSYRGTVQWAGAVATGSLDVRILDAFGREVYSFELTPAAQAAQGPTEPGVPSLAPGPMDWTIELVFTEFTGTMGLQVAAGG